MFVSLVKKLKKEHIKDSLCLWLFAYFILFIFVILISERIK